MLNASLYFDAKEVGMINMIFEWICSGKDGDKHLDLYGLLIIRMSSTYTKSLV